MARIRVRGAHNCARAFEGRDYKPQRPDPVRLKRSVVARSAEIPATTLHLAVDAQLGAHVLHAAGAAVDAALRRDPQLDALVIGFAAQIEAAVAQLIFYIRHGKWRLTCAVDDHAFAADFDIPFRTVTGGAQDQQFEIRIITGSAGTLDAIQLRQVESITGDFATDVGKQFALLVGEGCSLLQNAGATNVIDDELALILAWLEHQFAVSGGQLTLHPCLPDVRGTFSLAIEQLASGKQRQQGNKD
jgi:hypothetical protein